MKLKLGQIRMAAPRTRRKPNKKPLKSVPFDIDQVYAQAVAYERQGRIDDAIKGYRAILIARPRHARALNQMGSITLATGNETAALECFQKAARSEPRNAEFRNNIAIVHFKRREIDTALAQFERVLSLDSDHISALRNGAECHSLLGHIDKARAYLDRALALAPENETLQLDHARLLLSERARGEAEKIYRDLINRGAAHPSAYAGLSTLGVGNGGDLEAIERLLADQAGPGSAQASLHFAAGKIADGLKEYDRAFSHFKAGNELYSDPFDLVEQTERVRRLCNTLTADFFHHRRKFGDPSCRPVFIFGMPRSGTSLVEQILSSHTKVAGGGELPFFWRTARNLGDRKNAVPQLLKAALELNRKDCQRISAAFLDLLKQISPNAQRVVDKTPHNFERLWLLALLFPNAAFIHCNRNPVATCVSCYTNPMLEVHTYSNSLTSLGRYYQLYCDLMDHWRSVLPVKFLEVSYEALVSEPETQSRDLIAAMDLQWEDACLKPQENRRIVRTLSSEQVQHPVSSDSVDSWQRFDRHLDALKTALGDLYIEQR